MRSALITASTLLVLSSVTAMPVTQERQLLARCDTGKERHNRILCKRDSTYDAPDKGIIVSIGSLGTFSLAIMGGFACAGIPRCGAFFKSSRWNYLNPRQLLGLRKSVPVHPTATDLTQEVLQPHAIAGNAAVHHNQAGAAQPPGAQVVAPPQAPPQP